MSLINRTRFEISCSAIGVAKIFDWGGANHKSHAMTSSEILERGTFCGARISLNGRSEAMDWFGT